MRLTIQTICLKAIKQNENKFHIKTGGVCRKNEEVNRRFYKI
jgi:hypothetical protein